MMITDQVRWGGPGLSRGWLLLLLLLVETSLSADVPDGELGSTAPTDLWIRLYSPQQGSSIFSDEDLDIQ